MNDKGKSQVVWLHVMVVTRAVAPGQSWAWVTSAVTEAASENAVVLAGSLRRVGTAGKLVVITTSCIPEKARIRLYNHFDLVCVMDSVSSNNGFPMLEEHAKVFAFSLRLFQGCVYISPNSMVLKKCDDIITSLGTGAFIAVLDCLENNNSALFTFTPCFEHFQALRKILKDTKKKTDSANGDVFGRCIREYARNNKLKIEAINSDMFYKLKLADEASFDGSLNDLALLNFGCIDPRGAYTQNSSSKFGLLESYAIDLWWNIYHEKIYQMDSSSENLESGHPRELDANYDPIAIIGISCRLPGANNLDDFWKLLVEGREGIIQIPNHRWKKGHTITNISGTRKTYGGFLDLPIDEFDAKFFNISPKEAEFLDPQQRLLHEISWEAFEDAAIDPLGLAGKHVGVFVGSWIHDYKDIAVKTADRDFFRIYMGNSIAATAARLSFLYGITGPSVGFESGCSSAIGAVDSACKSLRSGETNLAMAAGVNLFLHPFDHKTMSFVLAPDGRCKTFDAKADGFGRAEGVGVLILKRMSDAIADGDKIWALIRGSALTQEGVSKSIGTPTVHGESLAMELALKDANVNPKEVSFLEAHGTGTTVGDPMEILAIRKVYSADREEPLIIASSKTNLGHTEAMSGITGIIKVILQMQNDTIAPHRNFSELNPEIDLESIPARLPLEPLEWKRGTDGKPRIAGVSSFGISGTDGHAIIQEAPHGKDLEESEICFKMERPYHFMKISTKTSEAMDELLVSYEKLLEEHVQIDSDAFRDVAYTANVGRAAFNHRAVIIARDAEDALKILKTKTLKRKEIVGGLESNICFLFTGQGSQYKNMAGELYMTHPVFKMAFDKCDSILRSKYNIEIRPVIWNSTTGDSNGSEDNGKLSRSLYSQIAIFIVEYCLLRLWTSWGIKANYALGHSLGEFAAAICCGLISLEAALELIVHRSQLIDALPQGKMLVLKAGQPETEKLLEDFRSNEGIYLTLDIAASNSSEQTVVAGDPDVVSHFAAFCGTRDVKCINLAATHAFHSHHMNPVLEEYRQIVEKVLEKDKHWKRSVTTSSFISGLEGKLMADAAEVLNSNYWVRHTREGVNFIEASKEALQQGCNIFIEIGPSPVLSALMMRNNSSGQDILCLPSLRKNQNDWITILDSLSKLFLNDLSNVSIDWKGFDQHYKRRKVALPFYPFQRKKIWVDFLSTPGVVHPLLGRVVPNASSSTIFESEITLKQVGYLCDHAVGNTVVFPGAGFLEMSIVGGHCSVQGLFEDFCRPRRPIVVKGLRIEAPLALHDGKACRLQTVIDLNDSTKEGDEGIGYSVKVYNWFQDYTTVPLMDENVESSPTNGQWKRHASACFLPLVTDEKPAELNIKIDEIKQNWTEISASTEMYEKLPEVGLKFGSSFQSLLRGWRNDTGNKEMNQESALFEVKVPTDEGYLVHPVVLDAMLQASMLWTNKDRIHKKLHVPVHIREYVWLSDGHDLERYVYCVTKDGESGSLSETSTFLVDGSGTILASMKGVEFIETTVKLVESVIQQQTSAMPQLWEEIWKPKKGPLTGRAKPSPLEKVPDTSLSKEILELCSILNDMDDHELRAYKHLDDLTMSYFLNALYKLGWKPSLGEEIDLKGFMEKFQIVDVAWNFMRYFFCEMVNEGMAQVLVNGKDHFELKIIKLPRAKEIVERLCLQTVVEGEASRGDYQIISEMGKGLPDFLTGSVSPLTTLFPEDPAKPNLGYFYDAIRPWVSKTGEILNNTLTNYNHLFYTKDSKDSVCYRVLEVGSGTGSGTKDYLEFLTAKQCNFEYTFTDISAAFFINGKVKFDQYKEHMIFKKFNIEEDPLVQGFTPEYYDLIVACEVIHATKDIRETLRNLRMLLKTNGHIQITETTKPDRRITLLVGLLEGYWRMTDYDLRPSHATMSRDKWVSVLDSTGYNLASSIGCYKDVHSYIFAFASGDYSVETGSKSVFDAVKQDPTSKPTWLIYCDRSWASKEIQKRLKCLNRTVKVIDKTLYNKTNQDIDENGKLLVTDIVKKLEGDNFEGILYLWALSPEHGDNQEQISLPFLHLCQAFLELHKAVARLYVVTRGAFLGQEDSDCPNPQSATTWGMAKTLRNEQPDISMHCIDLCPQKSVDEQVNEMFYELFWTNDGEELIAFREGKRFVPRLASLKITDDSLALPAFCDRYQLMLPPTKAISDLEFGSLAKYSLDSEEIEVQVKCCALNFRDIFAVLKPTEQFLKVNSIGSDYAGVVTSVGDGVTKWKVGDPVFGMNTEQQALPSHIKTKENMVIGVPENFTFAEAATIPAVFATALYCLVKVAKLTKDDYILIHSSSGGVGLSAIYIAQHIGAKIIATAGSRRKRAYLRSLGIQHVFHSRNTQYGDKILKATNGRGIDVVLNSLTGPGFIEASIKACAANARFVEMSKLNIWTEDQVHQLREDIQYTVADLTALEEKEWKSLLDEMMNCMTQNFVRPIPYVRFDAVNIRQAMGYLQKAKHIGKVVCVMPETKMERKEVQQRKSSKTMMFNDRSTYLITGGLGGIGFEVAKSMLNSGVKHMLLVSRSAPTTEIETLLKTCQDNGKRVEAWQVDVGSQFQVKEMLEKLKTDGWPQLRGIMHAAGVLSDGTIPNQSWEKFQKTYNAKVLGTINLHELTKHLQLEHFVLFSSVTSLFGSPGQCNHCASNAFEDAFAHYRHSMGLPATSINFANWGETGVATEIDFPGIRPIATNQGLRSIEAILKSNRLQTCVMNVDSFGMAVKLFPRIKGYLDDKRLLGDIKAHTLIINTDQFWGEVDSCDKKDGKVDVFKRYIKNMLKSTLKMDPEDNIDDNAEFQGLGVDSLMLLEMKNYLQNLFGKRLMLTAAHLKDCNSTGALATRLVDILEGAGKTDGETEESATNLANITQTEKPLELAKDETAIVC